MEAGWEKRVQELFSFQSKSQLDKTEFTEGWK